MIRVLSSLASPPIASPGGRVVVDTLPRAGISRVRLFLDVVRSAPRYDAVVLDGSVGLRGRYVDLLAAAALSHRSSGPAVVIADSTWKRGTSWLDRLARRAGLRLVDSPRVTYCVHSTEEARRFPQTWAVDPGRVAFTAWPSTLDPRAIGHGSNEDGYVFAGGDSLRDYGTLIEAARNVGWPVRIATRNRLDVPGGLPENVSIGPVSGPEFDRMLVGARVVVVPIRQGIERGAGQTTYTNAMAAGKPVVVTDSPGARDYVEDGVTGLVVPPADPRALARALRWMLDPQNAESLEAMGARAGDTARRRFTTEAYSRSVIQQVQATLHRLGRGDGGHRGSQGGLPRGGRTVPVATDQERARSYFDRSAAFWDDVYTRADAFGSIHRRRLAVALEWIDQLALESGTKVLDLGCGAGLLSVELAVRGWLVQAIDRSSAMARRTAERASAAGFEGRILVTVAEAGALPLREGSVAVVIGLGLLPWLGAPRAALREMARVTAPGGVVIVNVDNRTRIDHLLDPLRAPALLPLKHMVRGWLQTLGAWKAPGPHGAEAWTITRKAFDGWIADAGLEKIGATTLGYGPLTFWRRPVLGTDRGVRLDAYLQRLADRGAPFLRNWGAQYLVMARNAVGASREPG